MSKLGEDMVKPSGNKSCHFKISISHFKIYEFNFIKNISRPICFLNN